MHDILRRQLTPSQKEAVFHTEGPLLVLAGPGSGKTRVITYRIAALIESGVRPYNICAITFTNKAAEEMRQRAAALGASARRTSARFILCASGFFAGMRLRAGISASFSIYDEADQARCIRDAVKNCQLDSTNFPPARMLDAISALKNKLVDAESFRAEADNFFTRTLAKVYQPLRAHPPRDNGLDFDDLLMKTAFLLRDCPDVCSELGDRFKFLLIDEYQDTNHAQYSIAKALASQHSNICATGDPDQSIYRWRGADIRNILAFEKDWPEATVVKLEENFRSSPNILAAADHLIAFNRNRKEKKLIATKSQGERIRHHGLRRRERRSAGRRSAHPGADRQGYVCERRGRLLPRECPEPCARRSFHSGQDPLPDCSRRGILQTKGDSRRAGLFESPGQPE